MSNHLVIDCSAMVDALMGERGTQSVQALKGKQLHAPCLIDFELSSVVRRLVRTELLKASTSRDILEQWMTLDITRHPAEPLLLRMWEIRNDFGAYDAAYIALAEAIDAPLLTTDKRLARTATRYCAIAS